MKTIVWSPARDALAGAAAVLSIALVAAIWTGMRARGMWTATGTIGTGAPAFLAMWAGMMMAMMLPSMTPVASLYLRSLRRRRRWRSTLFVGGYTLVWAGSGALAYALALAADIVVARGGLAPRLFAAVVFAASAAYHLTPVQHRLLGLCRNPLGLIVQYTAYRGPLRHLRAGLHHGLTCLGCCWALMALMVVFGMMNVAAMVALGLVVAAEKLWARGVELTQGVGVISGALAVAVLAVPELAAGLTTTGTSL